MDYYCTNWNNCSMAGKAVDIDCEPGDECYCSECEEPMLDYEQYFEDGGDSGRVMGDNCR